MLAPGRDRACCTSSQTFSSPQGQAPRGRPSTAKARLTMTGTVLHQSMMCRPNATGTPGTDPERPPRPNTLINRTSQPLGGEDDGQPTKPAKHSTGNNATTSPADTRQRDEQRQNTPDGTQTAQGTAYSDQERPAKPIRASAQTQDRPTTGSYNDGEPTQRAGHTLLATQ